jgi:hypothetical protein
MPGGPDWVHEIKHPDDIAGGHASMCRVGLQSKTGRTITSAPRGDRRGRVPPNWRERAK